MGQERDGSPFAHKPKVPIVMSTPQNLEVLYEDNHIIAVNKRSSDIVQGDITNDRTLDNVIREYLRIKYDKPGEAWLGTIHRIDRPVSGVILYAKTSKCLSRMMKAFKHREVAKTYWAVVKGEPPQSVGHVVNYLRKNSERNKSYAYDSPGKDRKESELKYYLLGKGDHYHFVEVHPTSQYFLTGACTGPQWPAELPEVAWKVGMKNGAATRVRVSKFALPWKPRNTSSA